DPDERILLVYRMEEGMNQVCVVRSFDLLDVDRASRHKSPIQNLKNYHKLQEARWTSPMADDKCRVLRFRYELLALIQLDIATSSQRHRITRHLSSATRGYLSTCTMRPSPTLRAERLCARFSTATAGAKRGSDRGA